VQATADVSEAVAHVRPRWSPDGRKLVFQNIERTKLDIRIVDLDTGKLSWITIDLFLDLFPVWSPSGRFLYFSSQRSGGLNLWRIPVGADGSPSGRFQQLTTGAGQDVEAALSRDGRRLAFAVLRQNADLWRLPVEPGTGRLAGAPEKVIAGTRENSRGAFSPDGLTITFNSDRAGDMNIWTSSLTDRSIRPVTKGPGGDYQPRFSPDASRIAAGTTLGPYENLSPLGAGGMGAM
jgi:TolB protein